MAAEQRIVELVIDASGIVTGARAGEAALDHLGARGDAAAAKLQKMADRTIFTATTPRSIDQVGNAIDNLRAKVDPLFQAQLRAEREMVTSMARINQAVRLGVTTEQDAVRIISGLKQQQVEAINRVRDAQILANDAVSRQATHTPTQAFAADNDNSVRNRRQNSMYQVFDIGQGLAGGMPLGMIAAQQGPQLAQIYAGNGGVKAALADTTALAGSAAAAIGPIGLAFGAAGVAALGYYYLTKREQKTTDEVLSAHQNSIKRVADLWGAAATAKSAYGRESSASVTFGLETSLTDLLKKLDEANKPTMFGQGEISSSITSAVDANMKFTGMNAQQFRGTTLFKALSIDLKELQDASINGNSDAVLKTISSLEQIGRTSTNAGIKAIARDAVAALAPFKNLANAVHESETELSRLFNTVGSNGMLLSRGAANTADMGNYALFESRERVARERSQRAFDAQVASINALSPQDKAEAARKGASAQYNDDESAPARRLRIEQAAALALLQAEKGIADARDERSRGLAKAVSDQQLEITLLGKTAGEAVALRREYELISQLKEQARQNGGIVDEGEVARIRETAKAVGDLTDKLNTMKLAQDAQFETDQLFRSDREGRIASQLRSSGLDVDLGGQNAAMLRTIDILKQQKAAWEDVRDVGKDAVDQIVDSATGGFENIGDVFDGIAKDVLKQFTTLGVANPLKNAIFGGELPTMDTVGGIGGIFKALTGGSNPALDAASRSVGAMTVTAATVVVNGGIGGAAGAPFDALLGKGAANDNSPSALTSYAKAIQSIESSGNYGALGPVTRNGDRAYGAYQVMGNNIPSWSKEALGRVLTPEQFLGDKSAQDAIFNHRFGGYVDQYGASGAAQAWFGGPGSVGKGGAGADILGTTGNGYVEKFNKSLLSMANTTNVTTQGLGTLGNGLGQVGNALAQGGAAAPSGGGGGGLFGWLGSLFGGGGVSPTSSSWAANTTYSNFLAGVPGFADGTDSAPGGYAWIGERGKELMRVPRGAEIIPAHRTSAAITPSAPSVSFNSTVINNSSAQVEERETTDENGGRGVEYVLSDRLATAASKRGGAFDRQLRARGATMPRTRR